MIAIIAAVARNRVIGCNGRIPWDLPADRRHFRETTMGQAVIMGRRTYEEIGHPLPGRLTIVVSASRAFSGSDLLTVRSLAEGIMAAGEHDVFIAGGERLYREALPLADVLYLTEIDADYAGDTYFPVFDVNSYIRTVDREADGTPAYRFVTYRRRTREVSSQ